MNKIQKSISGASLIGAIFSNYKAGELNSAGELVRKRAAKYMRKRERTNHKQYFLAVMATDKAWKDAVNHFADKNMRIEAKSTVRAIFNYFEDELSKYANIRSEHIEKMMIQITDDAEAEHNSDIVIDFIIEKLGLEKRVSAFKTRFAILKGNKILEVA